MYVTASAAAELASGRAEPGGGLQIEREHTVAVNLKALLRRYVEGDELGFRVPALACDKAASHLLPSAQQHSHGQPCAQTLLCTP